MSFMHTARIALWEALGDEDRAATARWQRINLSRPAVCKCGQPGTTQIAGGPGFTGAEAPKFWRCDEHRDVPLTVLWSNGVPHLEAS